MGLDHDEKLVATIGGYKKAETTEAEKDGELAQVSVSRAAAMTKTSPCTATSVFYAVFRGGRTQYHPLSAIAAKLRAGNAHGGTAYRATSSHMHT